jgi:squalene-hopene/tetraprenyl-beta-curcumene cyclase
MLVIAVVVFPGVVSAQGHDQDPSGLGATIERGLNFLARDARAWKKEHNCASCHHAALVIWAMREARRREIAVDEPELAGLTKWVAESGDGKFAMTRPAAAPQAASPKAMYFALALGVDPEPDAVSRAGMKRLLKTVKDEQTDNGSWSAWPGSRPPILGGSDESLTALAVLALMPEAAAGDESARVARDRGIRWLSETRSDDDPQSVVMRLILWTRLGRPAGEWSPLVRRIKEHQNADGGWSQTKDRPSDAWATGQALYALASAGIAPDEPEVARGRAFLIRTQRENGSWPMTSRPTTPGDKGSESLIPIIGAGSAWAILGLVRSAGIS